MAGQVARVCKSFMRCGAIQQQVAVPCLSVAVHHRQCKMAVLLLLTVQPTASLVGGCRVADCTSSFVVIVPSVSICLIAQGSRKPRLT